MLHRLSGLGRGPVLLPAEQGGMGGVVERTQHPGNVAQGGAFDAPFRDGAGRFALEIDDDKIASREKHLSEMVIAVTADTHGADFGFEQLLEAVHQILFAFHDIKCQRTQTLGQTVELPPQQRQGFSDLGAHGLIQCPLVELGKCFRLEFRQALFRCQTQVHFGGAPAQQAGGFQIISDKSGRLVGAGLSPAGRREKLPAGPRESLPRGSREVLVQTVQGVTPGVAPVGNKPLQDGRWSSALPGSAEARSHRRLVRSAEIVFQ